MRERKCHDVLAKRFSGLRVGMGTEMIRYPITK